MPRSVATLAMMIANPSFPKPFCCALPKPAWLVTMVDLGEVANPASLQPFAKVSPACKASPRARLRRPSTS
eukprot:2140567-Pyramimonas_sp.AAC.1